MSLDRIAGGPANLLVRELDAESAFAALRDRLADGVEELMRRTGGAGRTPGDAGSRWTWPPPASTSSRPSSTLSEALGGSAGRRSPI